MNEQSLREHIQASLEALLANDSYLLEIGVNERTLVASWAHHLQPLFPRLHVDVEYNRHAIETKRAEIPDECASRTDENGHAIVIPDLVIHERGTDDHNLFVAEAKKSNDVRRSDCDRLRVEALKGKLHYRYAALVEFRVGTQQPELPLIEWV